MPFGWGFRQRRAPEPPKTGRPRRDRKKIAASRRAARLNRK